MRTMMRAARKESMLSRMRVRVGGWMWLDSDLGGRLSPSRSASQADVMNRVAYMLRLSAKGWGPLIMASWRGDVLSGLRCSGIYVVH